MNIFSVLDTSDNEEEQQKVVPKKGTVAKDAPKPKAAEKKEAPKPARVVPGMPPKENKTEKKVAAPAPTTSAKVEEGDAEVSKDNNRGGRPRGKGREREHKGGRGNHAATETTEGGRRPKREFDRRSGTGRGREVSRGGRGAFGLGNVDQDAQDAEKHPHEAKDVLEPVEQQTEADDVEAESTPVVPSVFTLDEFMEKREQARAKLHEIVGEKDIRKVDKAAQFGNLEPKNDTDLDAYMPGSKGKKEVLSKKDQRSTAKSVLDLSFKFQQNPQPEFKPRGDRPERAPRAGRGEGRRHEGKKSAAATETPAAVFSTQDFPSL